MNLIPEDGRIGGAIKGKKKTDEHLRNISLGKKGKSQKPFSEDHKSNIGKSQLKMVNAFDIQLNVGCRVTKKEFDELRGIRYIGASAGKGSGTLTAFNIQTKEFEKVSSEDFKSNKGIKYVGSKSKLAN